MDDAKLVELSERTLRIVEKLAQSVALENISTDHELNMISNLAPVILQELIAAEKASA